MKRALLLCLTLGVVSFAQSVRVTGGVVDDQVFQRNAQNRADIPVSGTVEGKVRSVEARLVRKHAVVPGFEWNNLATVERGRFSGMLKGVPMGGPYRLELRVGGAPAGAAISNILVGDLWVLAGQSNMEGVGRLEDVEMPHELVHNFDMADHWLVAEEPLHTRASAADRVHWLLNAQKQPERFEGEQLRRFIAARKRGAGLGLPFAGEMVRRTGVPVGLLSCAHGGTSMDQWDPGLKDRGGDSLYGSMLRRFQAAGGRVKGVLWYQGESDATTTAAPAFQKKFQRLVTMIREDFKQPDLPFYYVQIGRHIDSRNQAEWNLVQEMQRKAEAEIPHSSMVASVDSALDDGIHVSTPDLKRLGRRLANLACHDLFPNVAPYNQMKSGPRPDHASLQDGVVRVTFSGVNRRLRSEGRLSGFSVHNAQGEPVAAIFRAEIDPADPSAVLLYLSGKLPDGASIRYGYGKDPYCNLRDDADMGAPVFGPLPVR